MQTSRADPHYTNLAARLIHSTDCNHSNLTQKPGTNNAPFSRTDQLHPTLPKTRLALLTEHVRDHGFRRIGSAPETASLSPRFSTSPKNDQSSLPQVNILHPWLHRILRPTMEHFTILPDNDHGYTASKLTLHRESRTWILSLPEHDAHSQCFDQLFYR